MSEITDVSVIVCTRNVGKILDKCLESVVASKPGELIVIDGNSTDDTVEVAKRYTTSIISDEGKGLAHARNLGLNAASKKYVCYIGPDNILLSDTLKVMLQDKEHFGWVGVSAMTRVFPINNYISWAMNEYKTIRIKPGEKSVIGTPWLYDRDILKKFGYTSGLISSDDTDLCERLRMSGYKVGVSRAVVYEINDYTMPKVIARWLWYGNSDAEFWKNYSPGWNWKRKLKSILHPLNDELIKPALEAIKKLKFGLLPFLVFITSIRYSGWISASRRLKDK